MKTKKLLKTLFVLFVVILLNLPILIMLNTSLQTYQETLQWPIEWFKWPLAFENYWEITGGQYSIVRPIINSLIVASWTTVIAVVTSISAAYGLSRFDFIGKKFFLYLMIVTQMLAPILLASPLYAIFNRLGILDTRLSLIIANSATSLPMSIWLMYSYFQQVPKYLDKAARLDGSNRFQALIHIILPISAPGIITVGIFAFIAAWGDVVFASMSILSKELRPLSMALMDFEDLYKTSWELQMAASTLTVIPIFIMFLYVQKYLGQGLIQSGSKE